MINKLNNLEELPEFFTYPGKLFGSNTELPIYEIARLTYRQKHYVTPPYRLQEVVCVIGRSVNQGPVKGREKEYTLFCAQQSITRLDGTTIAINSTGKGVRSTELDAYETLRPNKNLYRWHNQRKL